MAEVNDFDAATAKIVELTVENERLRVAVAHLLVAQEFLKHVTPLERPPRPEPSVPFRKG